MAREILTLNIDTAEISAFASRIERMAAYFKTAPADDPVKLAMAEFGEIEMGKDVVVKTTNLDGSFVMSVEIAPSLQALMDTVPV